MCCIVYILLTYFTLRIGCLPSSLRIGSVRDVRNNEYPFIVKLESQITLSFDNKTGAENFVHLCTCVALRPTWSLTAGHCIASATPMKDLTENLLIQTVIRYGTSRSSTAIVRSTVLNPSFHDPLLKSQSNIGLLRTEPFQLKKFAVLSTVDINTLGGYDVTVVGHTNTNGSLTINGTHISAKRTPPQLLNAHIVRYTSNNESTLPTKCVTNHCVSSTSKGECERDSGGPLLDASGVLGISSIGLEKIKLCSALNNNGLVRMEFITPTRPHIKWINETVSRDELQLNPYSMLL